MLSKLFPEFKRDSREQLIDKTVTSIVSAITNNADEYTHSEQLEILNRISLRIFEKKKETRAHVAKEFRELQDFLKTIKLPDDGSEK